MVQVCLNTRLFDYENIVSVFKGLDDFARNLKVCYYLLFSLYIFYYLQFLTIMAGEKLRFLNPCPFADLLHVKLFLVFFFMDISAFICVL